jgi:hypothetical protein
MTSFSTRSRLVAAVALTSLGAFGSTACGAEDPTADRGEVEDAGSVGLELTLGSDVTVNTVAYEITGNGFTKTGNLNVSQSRNLRATIGGIPAGNAYTITLSGADATDPRITCRGSALFDVTPGATSTARVRFQCTLPRRNGSVDVIGTGNVCPRIDEISATPSETSVGGSIALSSAVTDSDRFPASVTYAWRTTSGTLDNATTPTPTFNCNAAGEFTITLDVSDSECADSASIAVTCTQDGPPEPPPLIKINEVESNGGVPGDWTELYNAGASPVNLGGFVFKDNDDTHAYVIANGTIIPPGGYFVVEEAAQGFGLGGADSARIFAANGVLLDSYSWAAHATTTYARCPNGTGTFATSTSVTRGAANDCTVPVKINEIESNGGVPGDWVELVNTSLSPVNVSGFIFKDNDDTHAAVLPANTIIPAGGYFVIEEALMGFGLGGGDSARLFAPDGTTVIDSHVWTAHAATTYGRCPNSTGDFATTTASSKGAVNECPGIVTTSAWPGADGVVTVDGTSVFGGNLSGLTYEAPTASSPAVLWAVRNGPGTLFRLIESGGIWTPDPANGWTAGKSLRYLDGTGNPDTEGFAFADAGSPFGYAATERNNDASTISRPSILRVDVNAAAADLVATHEWNLVTDLPIVGANLGPEAVTFVPDSFLTANSFFDETLGHVYDPAAYPDHGSGLFFVGLEANGLIYAYALNHADGSFGRVATIASSHPGMMGLEFDREVGNLWAACDDTANGQVAVLRIDTTASSPTFGRFVVRRKFERPTTMPNLNNEGIAFGTEAECVNGQKAFFWADDSETGGHSIRRDSIPCGSFF